MTAVLSVLPIRYAIPTILLFTTGLGWALDPSPHVTDDTARVVYVLDEVVVYFSKPSKNPNDVMVVTSSRIQEQSAHSLADVVKSDPGLLITSGTKNSSELRIRGGTKESVLYLLDGRPLNAGYYGSSDLSLLPVDQIEKIQIVKGPASVAYGANAMGGVVNIITKSGAGLPLSASVHSLFGDLHQRELSGSIGGSFRDYSGWLTVEESNRDGVRLSDDFQPTSIEDGGVLANSYLHRIGAHVKLDKEWGSTVTSLLPGGDTRQHISLMLSYIRAEKGLPSSPIDVRYWRFVDWLRMGGNVSALYHVSPAIAIKGSVFANQYDDELVNYLDSTFSMDRIDYDSRMVNWTYGAGCEAQWTGIKRHLLTAGFRGQEDRSRKRDINTSEPWDRHSTRTGSLFLEDRWQIADRMLITGGLGFYGFYKVDESVNEGTICPMISLTNELPWSVTTRIGVSRSIFFPTIHQLFSRTSGNANLDPEVTWKYEVSLEQYLAMGSYRYLNPELAVYYNDITNQIDKSPWTDIYRNIYSIKTWGVDASLGWGLDRWLSGSFGYGWLNWQTENPVILETPHYKVSGQLHGKTPLQTRINLEMAWFSQRRGEVSSNYFETMPSYFVCHSNITQPVTSWMAFRIEIRNLFDADYEEEYGYPSAGRTILAGLDLNFQRTRE